jgi:hypothetical protein
MSVGPINRITGKQEVAKPKKKETNDKKDINPSTSNDPHGIKKRQEIVQDTFTPPSLDRWMK